MSVSAHSTKNIHHDLISSKISSQEKQCLRHSTKQLCSPKCRQFSLRRFFLPNTSLTFGQFADISLAAVKFPNISRFFRQVVSSDTVHIGITEPTQVK